jgi:glycosyltransferase involved in cell wall biosynthesis
MVDGVTALVAADGDVEGLAAALTRLAGDEALKERLRAGGFEMAQRFGLDEMRRAVIAFAEAMQVA